MLISHSENQDSVQSNKENMGFLTRQVITKLSSNAFKAKQLPLAMTSLQQAKQRINMPQRQYATKKCEQNLLRFPVQPLKQTLDLFLRTCEPLLTEEEMKNTAECVKKFNNCDGPILQAYLEEAAQKEENWLATRWLRTAYLQYRDPVTVFSSPGMTFPLRKPFECDEEFVDYAAKAIFNLIKYKQMVDDGQIPVVKMGQLELDNSQFGKVFGTCRIPGTPEDCLQYNPDSKHVVVIHKNHFYKLPVYDNKCEPIHPSMLAEEMLKIIELESELGPKFGLLTADQRDNWATAYEKIMENEINKKNIQIIQQSLFTVSLDSCVAAEDSEKYTKFSEQLIHGGGSKLNSANRWMDKTIQLIINPGGFSGFTYEHSPAEGQPIALITDYLVKNLNNESFYECGSKEACEGATKLCLEPIESFEKFVCAAEKTVNELVFDLHTVTLQYCKYGKGFLKKQKLSPDSYIQMAQQFAFYKMHQEPAAHYESAHLRIYKGGRTETIRSCSKESVAFAKSMCNTNSCNEERVQLLKQAVNTHREYTNLALQGKAVDRHLLGLKLMANENKLALPSFFQCPGYVKSIYFRLSTSQVASSNPVYMCYGPLVKDGYGCCYNPREDDMFFSISSWRSCAATNADLFAKSLSEALDMMYELLLTSNTKVKAKL